MFSNSPLENEFIQNLIAIKIPVSVYLKSSIRLKGHLVANDEACVFLKAEQTQMIYKKEISTITPEMSFCSLFRG